MRDKFEKKERRKRRVRKKILAKKERPRLSVFRSNRHLYAQIIDDTKGITLVSVRDTQLDLKEKKSKLEIAFELGKLVAKKAIEKGIKKVVFDRSGYKYHGKVQRLAEGAREGGLLF